MKAWPAVAVGLAAALWLADEVVDQPPPRPSPRAGREPGPPPSANGLVPPPVGRLQGGRRDSSSRPTLCLQPLGSFGGEALAALRRDLSRDGPVVVMGRVPVPPPAWRGAGQYDGEVILAALADRQPAGSWLLAVADVDGTKPGRTHAFGLTAASCGRAVVFARRLARGTSVAGYHRRLVVTARHELGHLAGLGHCDDPRCVMRLSRTVADTDRKRPEPCRRCRTGQR